MTEPNPLNPIGATCDHCDCPEWRWNGDVITGVSACKCGHLAIRHRFRSREAAQQADHSAHDHRVTPRAAAARDSAGEAT